MNNWMNNNHWEYVSIDAVPANSLCEWCKKPAGQRYLVTAGFFHCQSGLFCTACGERFACRVERISKACAASNEREAKVLYAWLFHDMQSEPLGKEGVWHAADVQKNHGEEIITWEDYLSWLSGRYAQ